MVLAAAAMTVTVFSVLAGMGLVATSPTMAQERVRLVRASEAPTVDGPLAQPVGPPAPLGPAATAATDNATALPADSGTGRRIVFSQAAQRVWLVRPDGAVRRSYLVSGSVVDNLDPGTYDVYSRSRWAVGVDDSGVMEYFVRFTQGDVGAAIGFHTIPTKLGRPLQSHSQLGTPQSHGCIRQATADAIALWRFAPVGTPVVVV